MANVTDNIYTFRTESDFEIDIIQILKQNRPFGPMFLVNLWSDYILKHGSGVMNERENFYEFIRNEMVPNRPDLFSYVENKNVPLMSTIEAKSPQRVSRDEANIIQIILNNGEKTIDECIEILKENGVIQWLIPTHHQLKTFVHYRPNIFDYDENTDTISGIYKAHEMPKKIEICMANMYEYICPIYMTVIELFIIQILKHQQHPTAFMMLNELWLEYVKQGGLAVHHEAPKNIIELMDYIHERQDLFYVQYNLDPELSLIELKSPDDVTKHEASIIQIIRKNGMTTIVDCIEKLKENGVIPELIPTYPQLKTFVHQRPNIFDFDENTDRIRGLYRSSEIPPKISRCGLTQVNEILSNINQDVTNSVRVNLVQGQDQRQVIMFKTEWLYSKVQEFWDSRQYMVEYLNVHQNIMIRSNCLTLESLFEGYPNTDLMAREIVNVLYANVLSNQTMNRSNDEILDSLSEITRTYLLRTFSKNFSKKSSGLIRFTEFYPSLFKKDENGLLELVLAPKAFKKDENGQLKLLLAPKVPVLTNSPPISDLLPKISQVDDEADSEIIKQLVLLMANSQPDSIIVLDNCDRSVYSISWLHQNLPHLNASKNLLRKILSKYPNFFDLHVPFVNLASPLSRICEKIISLDILTITKMQPDILSENIVSNFLPKLLPISRTRIKTEPDLLHFLQMHKDFHHNELTKYISNGKSVNKCIPGPVLRTESILVETDDNASDESVSCDETSTASAIQEYGNSINSSSLTLLEVNVLKIGK